MTNYRRLFGTSGIRGVFGQDLILDFCREVAQAIATMLGSHSKVCIGTDTRVSRETVKDAVISGLHSAGTDVTDLGILPTPALAFLPRDMGFHTGIMITASHNPPEFNGIKLFNGNAIGYNEAQEVKIEKIFNEKRLSTGCSGNLSRAHGAKGRYFRFLQDNFTTPRYVRMLHESGQCS